MRSHNSPLTQNEALAARIEAAREPYRIRYGEDPWLRLANAYRLMAGLPVREEKDRG